MKIPDWKWILKWKVAYPIIHGRSYTRDYELEVRKAIASLSGDTFWDVGANTGYYTIPLARKFKRIIAFEPNPAAMRFLSKKVSKAGLTNITIAPVALSDSIGRSKLYLQSVVRSTSIGSCNTLLDLSPKPKTGSNEGNQSIQVPFVEVDTNTIDNILGKESVDMMKIDVEGAEFMVLEGGRQALKDHRIKNLVIELHDWKRKAELDALLLSNSYAANWLDFAPESAPIHVLAAPRQ